MYDKRKEVEYIPLRLFIIRYVITNEKNKNLVQRYAG